MTSQLDALARRTGAEQRRRLVRVGRLSIDRDARTTHVEDQPLRLTPLKFDLLQALAGQPHRIFGRDELTRDRGVLELAAQPVHGGVDGFGRRGRRLGVIARRGCGA
jgi:DNA-binding response OmpR family regulator